MFLFNPIIFTFCAWNFVGETFPSSTPEKNAREPVWSSFPRAPGNETWAISSPRVINKLLKRKGLTSKTTIHQRALFWNVRVRAMCFCTMELQFHMHCFITHTTFSACRGVEGKGGDVLMFLGLECATNATPFGSILCAHDADALRDPFCTLWVFCCRSTHLQPIGALFLGVLGM